MANILKKLCLSILCFGLCLSSAFSDTKDTINWKQYSPDIFKIASVAHRPVMIFAMSDYCRWCEKMNATTFNDAVVIKLVNDNFYPVILHIDKNPDVVKKYKLTSIPYILYFNSNGEIVNSVSGYIEPDNMAQSLTSIISRHH